MTIEPPPVPVLIALAWPDLRQPPTVRRAESSADLMCDLVAGRADPARRESQDQDPLPSHPGIPEQSALPVGGRQVPLARVHLGGNARLWPPSVGDGEQPVIDKQSSVVHRHGQLLALDQCVQVSFGGRARTVGHLCQRRAQPGRTLNRTRIELPGKVRNRDLAALYSPCHHASDVRELSELTHRIRHRSLRRRVTDHTFGTAVRHDARPVWPGEPRILALAAQRHQDIHCPFAAQYG